MRRLLAAAIAGVLAAAGAPAAADASHAGPKRPLTGIGIRLVDVPTATADDPRARTYIIDNLSPGSVIERRVQVINGTGSSATVSVYPAAASIEHGDFVGARGHTENELSMWTSTNPRTLVLQSRARSFVHVRIDVPADAAPGERYGVVWAEATTLPQTPGGVREISRVGIRLYLSIGQGGPPASDFEIMSMTPARDTDDAPIVTADIRNTGGRALDLSGWLTLTDGPGGLSAGPFPITLGTTLGIGQTEPVTVPLDDQIPDGPWRATLTVQSGLTKRTAQATVTFPAGPGVGATAPTSIGTGVSRWLIAAGVAAVMLLLVGLVRYALPRLRTA